MYCACATSCQCYMQSADTLKKQNGGSKGKLLELSQGKYD